MSNSHFTLLQRKCWKQCSMMTPKDDWKSPGVKCSDRYHWKKQYCFIRGKEAVQDTQILILLVYNYTPLCEVESWK